MKYSHEWLRAFVPHALSADGARALMTSHVATVDAMTQQRAELASVVVARVLEAVRHPNSDRLWLTRVDDGSAVPLEVVCGAPNVEAGMLYPFARTGTVLPGGMRIEERKIRGVTSHGMLCSARELALGEDQNGIMALEGVSAEPGTPLLAALPLGDVCFEVDVLPNRPDLLSHLGMAREVAALTGVPLQLPEEVRGVTPAAAAASAPDEARTAGVTVRIEDHAGCPRYMGAVIRGVRVGPSPDWLVRRLDAIGIRSISNVVDITNYVLHGFGQPMHAFDLARLAGPAIVVRKARDGETLVTLDGATRRLTRDMTVIADRDVPVAVAGVMGGRDSEVSGTTSDVFLEVAYFTPAHVRRARRALGLSTDASYRFERGIDPAITPLALGVAVGLLQQLCGGRLDDQPVDVGQLPAPPPAVDVRPARIAALLGDPVDAAEIQRLLGGIGFGVTRASGALRVVPPTWRGDVARECDIAEEVARLRGYDRLPDTLRPGLPSSVPDHPLYTLGQRVRDRLVALGFLEAAPLPFVSGNDRTHVRVANPLTENEPYLRRSILETLRPRAEYNLSRLQRDVRLFEVGAVFMPNAGSALPVEELHVGVLALGRRHPPHFTEARPPAFDEWDAKGLALELARALHPAADIELRPAAGGQRLWEIVINDDVAGEVVAAALDRPVWAADAFGVELRVGVVENARLAAPGEHMRGDTPNVVPRAAMQLRPLPTTPPAEFDLALLVPQEMPAATVEGVIRRSAGELLESLELFDLYAGSGLAAGVRSLAWRLTFRDPSRTLRDKEIDGRRQRILRALEHELGVKPRTS